MFNSQAAIASLNPGRSKRDEETARDVWKDAVYASISEIQALVDACQISASEGVRRVNAIVGDYYHACEAFKNRAVSSSCHNYESQDYPGGPQQGAFVTRRGRVANAGQNCGKNKSAPVTVITPTFTPSYTPDTSGAGCCSFTDRNTAISLGGGNVGVSLNGGGGENNGPRGAVQPKTFIERIAAAANSAVHGGDSMVANGGGYRGGNGGYSGGGSRGEVIPFPMKDAYGPLVKSGAPISGLDAWPATDGALAIKRVSTPGRDAAAFSDTDSWVGMSGFGDDEPIDVGNVGSVTVTASPLSQGISLPHSGPSTLQTILGTIAGTLPATISALKGQPYYNPATSNPFAYQGPQGAGAPGAGGAGSNIGAQAGAAVGNIGDTFGNIVAQHPYLVLAGVAGAVLLFMKPPSRR